MITMRNWFVSVIGVLGVMVSSAEALAQFRLSELLTTADKRTLRVRAEEHVKLRNDAAAVLLLEQWLQAAPADGEAAWS